ncbi:MAG TPA: hypothetical protein DDW73_20840 [Rhizobium sp.]|jgi:hypothetical protein|nr:hypothetical protein [Rhizobium sp.]
MVYNDYAHMVCFHGRQRSIVVLQMGPLRSYGAERRKDTCGLHKALIGEAVGGGDDDVAEPVEDIMVPAVGAQKHDKTAFSLLTLIAP